jgi:hypothetical protein
MLILWTDFHIDNPSDLQGASRTLGGHFRGKAHGNIFNLGDAKDVFEDKAPMIGKVKIFRAGEDPSTTKPHMMLKAKIGSNLRPVLDQLAKHYSPVKSKWL